MVDLMEVVEALKLNADYEYDQILHGHKDYCRAIDDVISLIRQHQSQAVDEAWQSIDSVPKDGTRILLGKEEDGEIVNITDDFWYQDRVMGGFDDYAEVFDDPPTHWAYIPLRTQLAPQEAKAEQDKRENCPWKCKSDSENCLCMKSALAGQLSPEDEASMARVIARYFAGHAYNDAEYKQCLGCVQAIQKIASITMKPIP